jgi:two-component system chemotaxis response regulator CheB
MALDVALSPTPPLPCFLLAAASGGLQAFNEILAELHPPIPPILLIQHIHPAFTAAFAERLQEICPSPIKVAAEGDLVRPDRILVASGGRHLQVVGAPPQVRVALHDDVPESGRDNPSFDVAFRSAARVYGRQAVGILLTGLGRDGVDGCKAILAAGGIALGQDEATSLVYGMSKIAFDEGALSAQFALDELPGIIRNFPAYRDAIEGHRPALLS